jgi:hypothetical protein
MGVCSDGSERDRVWFNKHRSGHVALDFESFILSLKFIKFPTFNVCKLNFLRKTAGVYTGQLRTSTTSSL